MTGDTAEDIDFTNQMRHGVPYVVAFVLALAFVLLLVAFRSIVVPIKAIVLNLLSVGASYGVLVLVFEHHWAQGVLDFRSDGAIISWLPLFLFVVLFGLSMDYHVFILSRVREGVDSGMRTEDALRYGISRTAGVVSAAALVMVGVFSLFGTASALDLKEAGVGLAVAVLLDATVVRGVLLPATMKLLGERNWYLPRLARVAPADEPRRGDPRRRGRRRSRSATRPAPALAPVGRLTRQSRQHEGEAVPPDVGGGRGRDRCDVAGGSRRRRSADRAGPIPDAARRRVADRLRTGVMAGAARQPARPRDGADRVRLVRGIAQRGDERTAVHGRRRDRVRVPVRVHLHRAVVSVRTVPHGGRQRDRRVARSPARSCRSSRCCSGADPGFGAAAAAATT